MLDENQEKVEDNKSNSEQEVVSGSEKNSRKTEQQVTSTAESQEVSGAVNEIEEEIAATAEESAETQSSCRSCQRN